MKLTEEQIEEIREMNKGEYSIREIALEFRINPSTVFYHLNKEKILERKKEIWSEKSEEEKLKISKKNLPYIKEYQRRRYREDEVFREKRRKRSNEYYARKSSNKNKNKD